MIKLLLSLFKLTSHEQQIIHHASSILAVLEANYDKDQDGQLALLDTAIAILNNKRDSVASQNNIKTKTTPIQP